MATATEILDRLIQETQGRYGSAARETGRFGRTVRSQIGRESLLGELGGFDFFESQAMADLTRRLQESVDSGDPLSLTLSTTEAKTQRGQSQRTFAGPEEDLAINEMLQSFEGMLAEYADGEGGLDEFITRGSYGGYGQAGRSFVDIQDPTAFLDFLTTAQSSVLEAAEMSSVGAVESDIVGQGTILGDLEPLPEPEALTDYVSNVNAQKTEEAQVLPDLGEQLIELRDRTVPNPLDISGSQQTRNQGSMKRI